MNLTSMWKRFVLQRQTKSFAQLLRLLTPEVAQDFSFCAYFFPDVDECNRQDKPCHSNANCV